MIEIMLLGIEGYINVFLRVYGMHAGIKAKFLNKMQEIATPL